MPQHLQQFIKFITTNNLKALLQHYINSSENENIEQLNFMFQQAEIKPSNFTYYQELSTGFIEAKGFPNYLISQITTNNALNFYTQALQIKDNFNKTDIKRCNFLHYLFTNNKITPKINQPPFNYLRSMLLFGSNTSLSNALCQRNNNNLTPVEFYLFFHQNVEPLPNHEFTALLALIEIEQKKQVIEAINYHKFKHVLKILCKEQINNEQHRILLIAFYYRKPILEVIADIQNIS